MLAIEAVLLVVFLNVLYIGARFVLNRLNERKDYERRAFILLEEASKAKTNEERRFYARKIDDYVAVYSKYLSVKLVKQLCVRSYDLIIESNP